MTEESEPGMWFLIDVVNVPITPSPGDCSSKVPRVVIRCTVGQRERGWEGRAYTAPARGRRKDVRIFDRVVVCIAS